MTSYYVISSDGRKFYYRDGTRISTAEGKASGARKRKSKVQSKKCLNGNLKSPVKMPSGRTRYCKKSRSRRQCLHGKLKSPLKMPSGHIRYCKKSRSRRHKKSVKKSRSRRSINPETLKIIKVGGRVYNKLVREGKIGTECNTEPCSRRQLCNPETGKCIKKGGRTHRRLINEGTSPIYKGIKVEYKNKSSYKPSYKQYRVPSSGSSSPKKAVFNKFMKKNMARKWVNNPRSGSSSPTFGQYTVPGRTAPAPASSKKETLFDQIMKRNMNKQRVSLR